MAAHGELIAIDRLQKEYVTRTGSRVHALGPVSLTIGSGELVSILGPSGCGKSTLLGLLTGLIRPSAGQVRIGGRPTAQSQRDIGVVFQTPVLLPWRTIIDNVLLPADVLRLDRAASRERARALLDMVGLDGFEEKYPRELSGGMQQRASIARSLLHEPQVLLMDEPFGALDAMTRESMNRELLKIWKTAGKTIVLVTHSISEAVFLSNRVIVLTPRPGTVAEIVDIDLPYPRQIDDLASDEFGRYIRRIRRHFQSE
jgi:NitT/TauT family transport system ATP-binding protein